MMSHLCNHHVREFLILARTWFAFGLPSKTRCDSLRPHRWCRRRPDRRFPRGRSSSSQRRRWWRFAQGRQGPRERVERNCDGTSQVIRPTYSCPCPTDLRQPCRCPWTTWQVRYLLSYLSRNVSPVLQTLQNIEDIEMWKRLHKLYIY
jgi:hypothetical protein